MKHLFYLLSITLILFTSCTKELDPFLISKQSIGLLNDSTQVKDLKTVFINDSVVTNISGDEFTGNINDVKIFEKGGKQLLILTPSQSLDSTSSIKTIRIMDERYKTSKGLSPNSSFKTLKDNYAISSVQNSLRNIIVSVNDINAYFTIDKKELPAEMRFDMNLKIDPVQIPDASKIKDFYLYWTKTP